MRRTLLLLVAAAGLLLPACPEPEPPVDPGPEACDAGEQAFATRAITWMWGRSPHGAAETRMWARAAEAFGRDTVLRAMAGGPEYEARWRDWLMDALGVARRGDQEYSACFAAPLLEAPSPDLVAYLRATKPGVDAWPEAFNMADVLLSSIAADDLSVPYRAWLFARMNRPLQGANVPPDELERARRQQFGEAFYARYLNRNLSCLPCHNSEFSTTGHPVPELDRTWEVPGLFEASLFGASSGLHEDVAYAMFRTGDLLRDPEGAGIRPWGMDLSCGRFAPDAFDRDVLGQEGFFIEDLGPSGSVWDLEAWLRAGIHQLQGEGRQTFDDGRMPGPQAFAWLVGASVVNQAWDEAFGSELVISHDFARSQQPRDRLEALTEELVQGRWSLSELLVGIGTDPYFNAAAPAECAAAAPYAMAPIFEPWSTSEEDEGRRGNGPGDIVHRRSARTLMRSVHDTMGWPPIDPYPSGAVVAVQADLGAPLRKSEPGFDGTDLGTLLTFEATYGAGTYPAHFIAACGPFATPGCNGCSCEGCVCEQDSFCCDFAFDELCVAMCNDSCGGCQLDAEVPPDVIQRLLVDAAAQDLRIDDVVLAIKDRITGDGGYTSQERLLIESLLGTSLATLVSEADGIEAPLRAFCGALLIAPESFLTLDAGAAGEVPTLALDADLDCSNLVTRMAAVGVDAIDVCEIE